jgi:multicomponent Na+:H+ antiporter subunit F
MSGIFLGIAIYMIILIALPLYRLIKGPTVFDRVIGAGLIGINSVLLLAVIGFGFERLDMFIDLAIVYALLNFIGTVAAAKYLERGKNNK